MPFFIAAVHGFKTVFAFCLWTCHLSFDQFQEIWSIANETEKCLTVLQTNARTDALARLGLSLTLFRHSLRTIVRKHVLLLTYVYFLPSMLVNKFFDDIKIYWSSKWLVSFSCKYDGSANSLKVFLLCIFYFLVVNIFAPYMLTRVIFRILIYFQDRRKRNNKGSTPLQGTLRTPKAAW